MRLQPFMVLTLLFCGAIAAPVAAQQDERFFGRWEPASTSAGGSILLIERNGYLTSHSPDGQYWHVRKYQVIRDFGDRLVIRASNLGLPEGNINRDLLVVLEYVDDNELTGHISHYLNYDFCINPLAHKYFFKDHDPDNIWQRILEWSARADEGRPYDQCNIFEDGEFPANWSGMSWFRRISGAEE